MKTDKQFLLAFTNGISIGNRPKYMLPLWNPRDTGSIGYDSGCMDN